MLRRDAGQAELDAKLLDTAKSNKKELMHTFARFVIAQGFGAAAPKSGKSWQRIGQERFGPEFPSVMHHELNKGRAPCAGGSESNADAHHAGDSEPGLLYDVNTNPKRTDIPI